jgi:hypothetical protein
MTTQDTSHEKPVALVLATVTGSTIQPLVELPVGTKLYVSPPKAPPGYRLQPISEFDAYRSLLDENERMTAELKAIRNIIQG